MLQHTASHMAVQALYLWQSRYNRSRVVSTLLCDRHRWRLCVYAYVHVYVYVRALLYAPGMCEWSVCCHTTQNEHEERWVKFSKSSRSAPHPPKVACSSSSTQRHQHKGSRVSSSCLCAGSHGVCVCGWCTAGDRTTTTFSHPTHR